MTSIWALSTRTRWLHWPERVFSWCHPQRSVWFIKTHQNRQMNCVSADDNNGKNTHLGIHFSFLFSRVWLFIRIKNSNLSLARFFSLWCVYASLNWPNSNKTNLHHFDGDCVLALVIWLPQITSVVTIDLNRKRNEKATIKIGCVFLFVFVIPRRRLFERIWCRIIIIISCAIMLSAVVRFCFVFTHDFFFILPYWCAHNNFLRVQTIDLYERLNERERKAKKKHKPLRRYVEMSSAKPPKSAKREI